MIKPRKVQETKKPTGTKRSRLSGLLFSLCFNAAPGHSQATVITTSTKNIRLLKKHMKTKRSEGNTTPPQKKSCDFMFGRGYLARCAGGSFGRCLGRCLEYFRGYVGSLSIFLNQHTFCGGNRPIYAKHMSEQNKHITVTDFSHFSVWT